jgi:hypothetical protein
MARVYNSTIQLKQKTCISCGKPCIWFSKQRCQECARIEDTLAKDKSSVIEEEDLRGLIDDADALVSRYVRLKAVDKKTNMIRCFTCGNKQTYGETDCGHYVPRTCMYLRFDLRNLRPQCHTCNRIKYGRVAVFAQNLEKENPGLPEILLEESRVVYKIGRDELRQIISEFTEKIQKLKS